MKSRPEDVCSANGRVGSLVILWYFRCSNETIPFGFDGCSPTRDNAGGVLVEQVNCMRTLSFRYLHMLRKFTRSSYPTSPSFRARNPTIDKEQNERSRCGQYGQDAFVKLLDTPKWPIHLEALSTLTTTRALNNELPKYMPELDT